MAVIGDFLSMSASSVFSLDSLVSASVSPLTLLRRENYGITSTMFLLFPFDGLLPFLSVNPFQTPGSIIMEIYQL